MYNIFIHVQNMPHFLECVTVLKKVSNEPTGHVFLIFQWFLGVFVTDLEMTDNKGVNIPSIRIFGYENVSSCLLHKKLLPEDRKACILWMKL